MRNIPNIELGSYDSDDPINRALETRRDNDTFVSPSIELYDIDYSIYHSLNYSIVPQIEENEELISVPIRFAGGDTTAQIQRHGYVNDKNQKAMTPLITIQRTGMGKDTTVPMSDIPIDMFPDGPIYVSQRQHNNQFDRIDQTTNSQDSIEYFISVLPKHVLVNYTINIWTEYQEQNNKVVQAIDAFNKKMWGDSFKFRTTVGDFDFETLNTLDDRRIVRSTTTLEVNGILQDEYIGKKSTIKKAFSLKRIDFKDEREQPSIYIDDKPEIIRPKKSYLEKLRESQNDG